MDRRWIIALAACLLAARGFAGYEARESWIVVVGHATGFGGRGFYTTVYLTNTSHAMNDVVLSFFASAQPNRAPRSISLQLGPNQSGAVDVGPPLVGEEGAIGALRIQSTRPLIAQARVYSRGANESPASEVGTVLNAIPSQFAIGTGESTFLHVPAGVRYKLYTVETHGFPLYFSVNTSPHERRLYLAPHEQRAWDLPDVQTASLRITGINGSGKIVVVGTAIAGQSHDFSGYEMLLPIEPRHRLRWPELLAYSAIALALALTALYKMKKPQTE
ncbi:MAG TPA: hypothetical protein VGS96_16685 [Thermoanaerobaculia bacterium]|nr:hypothetical protein [Thermoanaerobaculia bacterium]